MYKRIKIVFNYFPVEVESDHAEKKTSRKTEKKEESDEEVTSGESDYEPSRSEESSSGSSSEEEMSESEKIVIRKKESSLKRKRSPKKDEPKVTKTEVEKVKPPHKKQKKEEKKSSKEELEGEKSFKEKKESPAKKATNFDVGRVDFNLHTEDPNNIVQKTVQISTGLKLTCKMLAGATMSSGKVTYPDWAALIFQKKIKDDKCFEFNVSLKDAPKLIEGLKYIISENKTFFNS